MEEGAVNSDGTITKTTVQTYTYGTGDWKDLLTAVNGNTIIYEGQTYNESTGEIEGAATGNPTSYPVNGTSYDLTWQNGRQLAAAEASTGATDTVLSYTYDTDGIRTSKTYTVSTYEDIPQYTVIFVADGVTVKTMTVNDGYTLQSSDYPTVPAKTGYTGSWQQYTTAIHSNVTIQAIYTAISTHTVTFVADLNTVKTMTVNDGYILQNSDYPAVPRKLGYVGSWNKYTAAIHDDITITAVYVRGIPSPTQPSGEIMSEEEVGPWSIENKMGMKKTTVQSIVTKSTA